MSCKFFSRTFVLCVIVTVLAVLSTRLPAQVVINEVLASNRLTNLDEDRDSSDWLELYNRGTEALELEGHALSDDPAEPRLWTLPSMTLAPDSYLLVWCSGKDRTEVAAEDIAARNSPFPFVANVVSLDDEWRFLAGGPEAEGPPAGWTAPGFDDSAWERGVGGFGFGRDDGIRTPIPEGATAVFLRRTFAFRPGQGNLVLQARYDDGIVLYLNGERVASSGFPEDEEPTFASTANRSHSSRLVERFDLTPWLDRLEPGGGNVLGIALLNRSATSSDLVLFPELGNVPPVLHASFEIRRGGETLLLVDPEGEVIDRVDVPRQWPDQSFGRSPDGTGPFRYHLTPTPLARNAGPTSPDPLVVADTRFSRDRGFYDAPFEVAVTTETPGAEIRYTLDGSEPTETDGLLYEGPIAIEGTTTLRARAFKAGHRPSDGDTHTYIFLDDVLTQDARSAREAGFPQAWGGTRADYAMDSDVIGPGDRFGGIYAETIRDDLRSLPVMSVVMDVEDLFGSRGIYANPTARGIAWERPGSVELFSPDGAAEEFQVNCGVRIQGGYFRQHSAARKHSLRLLFKGRYGPPKLRFPLFGEEAAGEFDTVTLRAGANDGYSWNAARLTEQYTRDEFGRDLQLATGNAAARGRFVHLYLNGLYWGLYNPTERPDHSFSAIYHGGRKDDWDALHDGAPTNGDTRAWSRMLRLAAAARRSLAAYHELQGRNPDGSPNPELPHLLDVPNYADYLIVNLWGGNWDWPWKNWWAARDRSEQSTGFKFYCWDYENTMGNNRSRSPLSKNALQNDFSSAGVPHQNLRSNPEYRLLFADRVHRVFFDGGVLAPESLIARYEALAASVERAIVAESARWGDQHHHPPLGLREWEAERRWILETYLPRRTDVVLRQFRAAGLYPRIDAPIVEPRGGLVPAGSRAAVQATEGIVYYTTDGSDPRLPGGELSPEALIAEPGEGLLIERTTRFRSRARVGEEWSALNEADFVVDSGIPLRITEVMYHPPPRRGSVYEADEFEFLELQNVGSGPLDLSDVRLRGGVEFGFSGSEVTVLGAGERLVLVENRKAFRTAYDTGGLRIAGEYRGRLGNAGEALILEGFLGEPILEFAYRDDWLPRTDGQGASLVIVDPLLSRERWGEPESWRESLVLGGSPGTDDTGVVEEGGRQRPGDASQDGRLSITDAVIVLRALFTGEAGPLPCEDETISSGGNLALHDVNASGGVGIDDAVFLLDYLFRRGLPPALGAECVRIEGCPDACGG